MAALAGGAGPLVPAFNGFDFGAPKLAQKLRDFSVAWDEIRRNAGEPSSPNFYPNLDDDPLLTPDAPEDAALLKRYLIAETTLEKSIEHRVDATFSP